jgi:hypothetical protein
MTRWRLWRRAFRWWLASVLARWGLELSSDAGNRVLAAYAELARAILEDKGDEPGSE